MNSDNFRKLTVILSTVIPLATAMSAHAAPVSTKKIPLPVADLPDIVPLVNLVVPAGGPPGGQLLVKWQAKNNDLGAATNFTTRFYFSTDYTIDLTDSYTGVERTMSLVARATSVEFEDTITIPADQPEGELILGIIVDYNSKISESDEANNTTSRTLTVSNLACYGKSPEDPTVCGGHGVCEALNSCQCEIGYDKPYCDPVCYGHCVVCEAPDTCSACVEGWRDMPSCLLPVCDPPCGTNAICRGPDTCECENGYLGDGYDCLTVENCTSHPDWTLCQDGACFAEICEAIGENDRCDDALAVSPGETLNRSMEDFRSFMPVPAGCAGDAITGPDAFFLLEVDTGWKYTIEASPGSNLDVAIVTWPDCSFAEGSCSGGTDKGGRGSAESLELTPEQAGSLVVQVIGTDAVSGATSLAYAFRVTAEQIVSEDIGSTDSGHIDTDTAVSDTMFQDIHAPIDTNGADIATADIPLQTDNGAGDDTAVKGSGSGCTMGSGNFSSAILVMLAAIWLLAAARRRQRS
jgi:hypothetical protein